MILNFLKDARVEKNPTIQALCWMCEQEVGGYIDSQELEKDWKAYNELEDILLETFSPTQKKAYDLYLERRESVESLWSDQSFIAGFKLAMKLLQEVNQ